MQKINTLLALVVFMLMSMNAFSQRYLTEIFDEVVVTSDVVYGVNATVLLFGQVGEAVPQALTLDVYEPMGDNNEERPLVLVFHTGNFLPNVTNGGIMGTKTDSSAVEICTRLAKMGYTAASVDYRQGWNPLAQTQPERALGLIQAAYRGIQDGNTAIRFFKKTQAEDGNPYSIDPDRIAVWGNGTGGYLTLGLVGVDEYAEIVMTTNGPGKFLLDLDMDGTPETPMVVPVYHGDPEGKVLTVAPDAAFGLPAGDTTNYPNHTGYSSDFDLAMNVGGALGDISWLEDGNVPTITVQSANDEFAPYGDDVLIVPTTGDPIVRVQGGLEIATAQNGFGNNDVWGTITDPYTQQAMDNSAKAGHAYFKGLYPVVRNANQFGRDDGVPIDWWDENSPAPGAGMGIPWNQLPHPVDPTGTTSFHQVGLLTNGSMSAANARLMIDTCLQYFLPRAYEVLDLIAVNTDDITAEEVDLLIAPNPAQSNFMITSDADAPIQQVRVFDMEGRLMQFNDAVNESNITIERNDLAPGMYFVMITFEEGVVSKKVLFN